MQLKLWITNPGPMSLSRWMWMPVSMQANRVNDEIKRDQQLTNHRNFEAVSPATEPIHDHGQVFRIRAKA